MSTIAYARLLNRPAETPTKHARRCMFILRCDFFHNSVAVDIYIIVNIYPILERCRVKILRVNHLMKFAEFQFNANLTHGDKISNNKH